MTPSALAALRQQDRVSFPYLLAALHQAKHTGAVVIHFSQGTPGKVEFPCEPTRIALDNRKSSAHS